ncbi:WhiB family transcriptional regulator [Kineococcus sp. R86509]|uniref:WhiB family transcriptional regulator n=1 Tax=Kineococcus sp. R86509 TaxID=3093851 RepID=UPI0036D2AD18
MIRPEAARVFYRLASALADVDGATPCRDRDEFHDDDRRVRAQVAQLCTGCPVLQACGDYAEAADERHGVWAGRDRTRTATRKETAA